MSHLSELGWKHSRSIQTHKEKQHYCVLPCSRCLAGISRGVWATQGQQSKTMVSFSVTYCPAGAESLLVMIPSPLQFQRHLGKWEEGPCWFPHFAKGENRTLKPFSISTNFQLLKLLSQGWALLSQGERATVLIVIPLTPFSLQYSRKGGNHRNDYCHPGVLSPLSLQSVTSKDQMLCLIVEGVGHRQFWQPVESRLLWKETHFPGALSFFFFFLPWRDRREMSRDFRSFPSSTVNQPRSPAKAARLSPNAAPS